jgi:hypothetical protein
VGGMADAVGGEHSAAHAVVEEGSYRPCAGADAFHQPVAPAGVGPSAHAEEPLGGRGRIGDGEVVGRACGYGQAADDVLVNVGIGVDVAVVESPLLAFGQRFDCAGRQVDRIPRPERGINDSTLAVSVDLGSHPVVDTDRDKRDRVRRGRVRRRGQRADDRAQRRDCDRDRRRWASIYRHRVPSSADPP